MVSNFYPIIYFDLASRLYVAIAIFHFAYEFPVTTTFYSPGIHNVINHVINGILKSSAQLRIRFQSPFSVEAVLHQFYSFHTTQPP